MKIKSARNGRVVCLCVEFCPGGRCGNRETQVRRLVGLLIVGFDKLARLQK